MTHDKWGGRVYEIPPLPKDEPHVKQFGTTEAWDWWMDGVTHKKGLDQCPDCSRARGSLKKTGSNEMPAQACRRHLGNRVVASHRGA